MRDLALAEARCRHREALADGAAVLGAVGSAGVRLLFRGPSGTGKTLAARTLAGVLGLDLYAVDIASVVDRYLGVTEQNLDRLFSRAEETGAALLLDEGDALMTQRTAVQSSNDRYANLETNFLLQRLESFDGLLVVTTNAGKRIDSAFERRMDVVVDFGPPGEVERWWLWRLHLPSEHEVVHDVVDDLAVHCQMTGAEIRKTTLHAALLALEEGSPLRAEHLLAATRRELEKAGRSFPLPREVGRG
jgi:SpoVK/Ycf46/Vps4 family AAA+-type ATPase